MRTYTPWDVNYFWDISSLFVFLVQFIMCWLLDMCVFYIFVLCNTIFWCFYLLIFNGNSPSKISAIVLWDLYLIEIWGFWQKFGRLDILVSNAAANPSGDSILDISEPVLDKLWEVNVKAGVLLTQVCFGFHLKSNSIFAL